MTVLLDGNVLIALTVEDHLHHAQAEAWLAGNEEVEFATTPITQGTLLRLLIRHAVRASDAIELMARTTADSRHTFWSDDRPYDDQTLRGVIGHRQVTDSYLASLARHRAARVATFDSGFAAAHPDVAELIPTS
jgi:uncharacterized protein